jgi:hypothetical protein
MIEHLVVNDMRTGVMLVRNSERLVAVWASVFKIDRSLQPDERECRLRVRIHRGKRGAPILMTKRGRRSSFLTGRTLRRFEIENGLQVRAVELRDLDTRATSEHGRCWSELTHEERLQVFEWIAEG